MKNINIFRAQKEMCRDLRSGNYLGNGTAYPNAVDWDIANAWSTKCWVKLTGIDEQFLITAGTTGMLDLIFRKREKNINVGCFIPAYDGFLKICDENDVLVVPFKTTLDMKNYEYKLDYIYLNTNFRNPDGYSMKKIEMEEIIAYAHKHEIIIIEDDPYFFLEAPAGRKSFLELYDKTIYLNSFSKCCGSPGLRIGCFASRNDIIRKDIWEKMRKVFMYPNPFVLQELAKSGSKIEKLFREVARQVKGRQKLLNGTGFYTWRRKDAAYDLLTKEGYKVKEGVDFGVPGWYRVSTAHLFATSEEFDYILRACSK